MDAHFLGAPSRDRTWIFSTFLLCFGGVLEETHGTAYLEVVREVLKEEQEPYIKFNLIELYVIKS